LYELSLSADTTHRWRFHGETPSPETFASRLSETVLTQFVAEELDPPRRFGLVAAYAADSRDGYAYLAVLFDPEHRSRGWPIEACALFINYLFAMLPLRKLYLEGVDFNIDQYASALRSLLVEEARLKSHVYYAGRFADLVTLALYRQTWDTHALPIVQLLLR
jgi:RimJ/RimL family protein N-acetyltransferase